MNYYNLTQTDLEHLINEYKEMHGTSPITTSVFNTWLCGHCHTYPRRAKEIIDELKSYHLIKIIKSMVYF